MHLNLDFIKEIGLTECLVDNGRDLNDEMNKMLDGLSFYGLNVLYNRYGDEYEDKVDIPTFLWIFRLCDDGIIPSLDARFPTIEDIYTLMKDEGYTESEINKFKSIPWEFLKEPTKNTESLIKEGTTTYEIGCSNWSTWMGDRTKPAPIEAVTFWKDYTETNTWKLTHDFSEELGDIYEDKTQEEIKEIVSTLAKNFFGDVLESTRAIPIDFDEKGGQKFTKTFADGTDEDTYKITDYYGDDHMLDGKEKAIEKATELVNEKIKFQFGMRIERKITEPDGYFAWRQENREDYL